MQRRCHPRHPAPAPTSTPTLARCGRAVVQHQPPAAAFHAEHVGGDNVGLLGFVFGDGQVLFDQVYGHGVVFLRLHHGDGEIDAATTGKNRAPAFANGLDADQDRPSRMNADDIGAVGPDRHHGVQIGALESPVKSDFGVFGGFEHGEYGKSRVQRW